MAIEKLKCLCGCETYWERQSTRGRKPKVRPEHKTNAPVAPAESVAKPTSEATPTTVEGTESGPRPACSGAALAGRVHEDMKRLIEKDRLRLANHRKHTGSEL